MPKADAKAPWEKAAPKNAGHAELSRLQKASAKHAAEKAGRSYPNLVDNMRAAKQKKKLRKP
jgi:hypothetical protein